MSSSRNGSNQSEETRLFFSLTPEKILDAAESTGLRCSGRCLPLNSLENRVFQVELELTDDEKTHLKSKYDPYRVLKFYRPGRWEKAQILEEHEFVRDLSESDIPVSSPQTDPQNQTLYELEAEGIWFTIFPKAGGRIEYETSDAKLEMLGRYLARLHMVGQKKTAQHRVSLNPETFGLNNLNWLLERKVIPIDLESRYRKAVEAIVQISEPLFKQTDSQRIHGDCHLGNVLWDGDKPLWVDFDDMVTGPCVQDVWLLVPNRDDEGLRQREVFLKAYETMAHFDRNSLKLIEILRAFRYIHYSAWIGRRWDDPAFKNTFPDYMSWQYWSGQVLDMEEQLRLVKSECQ